MARGVHRVGILVAVALVVHVWMLPTAGASTLTAEPPSDVVVAAGLPGPAHCPHGMVACRVQAPSDTGDELVLAGLLAVAAVPVVRRSRRDPVRAADPGAQRRRSRIDVLASVVLLE